MLDLIEDALRRRRTDEAVEEGVARSDEHGRELLRELFRRARADGGEERAEAELPAATAFGSARAEAGVGAAAVAREVLQIGRGLEEVARERGLLDAAGLARLRELVDEAVSNALEGHGVVCRERRDGWLSYYTHELRNPLNTLVNAIWLLRNAEHGTAQTQRICDMAERAARRLEGYIREVRQLEEKFAQPPPPRPMEGRGR